MPRFSPEFLDELKSRLRPSEVIGRTVSLKKQGNEYAGLSPFTKEKTPSFFVNDQKGFFHCFSSGKHGDVISFLQETHNLPFHEAVATLAEEAGMELPKEDPKAAEREAQRKGLVEACEEAQKFFTAMLTRSEGRAAQRYARQERGLSDAQLKEFGVGYAPGTGTALKDTLVNRGFHEDTLAEAGLIIRPEDRGKAAYDKFRDRLMFPIRDPRGRVIAFGGRALKADIPAKYMNSPDTPIFHKGAVLYRYGEARTALATAGDPKAVAANTLLVCEGYMDVVALWGAGFRTAIAALGTAITENQLAMLWRVCDRPVLCLDGDMAGLRAAHRAIDRSLPLLKPGKTLRFAFLPEGTDPDDLVKAKGAHGFSEIVSDAKPLIEVLWQREATSQPLDTPEARAAFRARLRALVKTIADRDVRDFYADELKQRLGDAFGYRPAGATAGSRSPGGRARGQWVVDRKTGRRAFQPPPPIASPELKTLLDRQKRSVSDQWVREATLVLAIVNHPDLLERREAEILALDISDARLRGLLRGCLDWFSTAATLDSADLKSHLRSVVDQEILERLEQDRTLNSQSFLADDAAPDEVDWGFDTALGHHVFETDYKEELTQAASQIFAGQMQDGATGSTGLNPSGTNAPADSDRSDEGPDGAGLEIWRQTAQAREDLINRHRASNRFATDGDGDEALDRLLERMRASVNKTSKK